MKTTKKKVKDRHAYSNRETSPPLFSSVIYQQHFHHFSVPASQSQTHTHTQHTFTYICTHSHTQRHTHIFLSTHTGGLLWLSGFGARLLTRLTKVKLQVHQTGPCLTVHELWLVSTASSGGTS